MFARYANARRSACSVLHGPPTNNRSEKAHDDPQNKYSETLRNALHCCKYVVVIRHHTTVSRNNNVLINGSWTN